MKIAAINRALLFSAYFYRAKLVAHWAFHNFEWDKSESYSFRPLPLLGSLARSLRSLNLKLVKIFVAQASVMTVCTTGALVMNFLHALMRDKPSLKLLLEAINEPSNTIVISPFSAPASII